MLKSMIIVMDSRARPVCDKCRRLQTGRLAEFLNLSIYRVIITIIVS